MLEVGEAVMEERDERELPRLTGRLAAAADTLESDVKELEARLAGILRPDPDTDIPAVPREALYSPVGQHLDDIGARLHLIDRRVRSVLERLEV